jgi:hypothetical protein
MIEILIEPLAVPLYALSTLATTVALSCLVHVLAKPVAKEALASVDSSERHMRHTDRVVTNFSKACCLFLLTINPLFWYVSYEAFWSDKWENLAFTRMVVILYTATDLSSFLTTWMPKRTAFHHGVTGLFAIVTCAYQDILTLAFPRLMLWYGLCSTVTYLVNFFIGTIYCFNQPLKSLAIYAATIYAAALGVNWIKYMPALVAMLLEERLFFAKSIIPFGFIDETLVLLIMPWVERFLLVGITSILVHDDIKLLRSLIDYSGGIPYDIRIPEFFFNPLNFLARKPTLDHVTNADRD